MGRALARLLRDLNMAEAEPWINHPASWFRRVCFLWRPCAGAFLYQAAAQGYLWSWAENQVAAAIKLVPLGQTAGQRILSRASEAIPPR